ncbi:MAG: DUF1320 domain-containing protein [Desulfuromonadales bacterium]|nr:DUF1320 domain-containing protein [Desulfuromonadales bacterium]
MYSTQEDILERLPEETVVQLTDDEDSGDIDAARVVAAIERADQEIDAWCGSRFHVPFTSTPAIIGGISTDLAIYYLYGRTQEEIPQTRKDAYDNALRTLEQIADGKLSLGAAEAASSSASSANASFCGNTRRFTRDSLKGM